MNRRQGGRTAASIFAAVCACVYAGAAFAEPVTLRFASAAPEGTAWAREIRAFAREVETLTHQQVLIKWYLSGVAGDEVQSHERVMRDQLDGIMSGGMLCQRLAPSLRVAGMVGEFRDGDEAHFVLAKLKPLADAEMAKAGYVNVADAGLGFSIIFSRTPVRTMAELRKLRPWLWSLDEVLAAQLPAMGMSPLRLPVEGAGRAYDAGKVDGFVGLPSAALAFQWSTQARYVTNLRVAYLTGCMVMARRAWDQLSHEDQQLMLTAAAKLQQRVEDLGKQSDDLLIGGLFAKQGLQPVPASAALQSEFAVEAREARKAVAKLTSPDTIERVAQWIAEYRRMNRRGERR